ncbi:MAG: metallophosphoesterase family protein [Vicinamibacterales bacterium]
MSRNQIATYIPAGSLESAATTTAQPRGRDAREPTADELAELVRALQILESAQSRPGIMATAPDELVSNLQTFITTVMAPQENRLAQAPNATLEAKFDSRDILGWAGSFFSWWRKLDPFDWKAPGAPDVLPASCRIALFGDWGTGLYGAPVCAKSIEQNGKYDVVLHLGDVYYSGTKKEIADRFLDIWPKVNRATNRGLNGNHEMYTGGQAYFDAISTWGQTSSYFALQNEHWILACLDTAYADHDLHGDQAKWVQDLAAASPQKKLVLFSHHQPFSLLDSQGPKLVRKLAPLFESKRIFAWYWGHEHHCILYKPHALYELRGRCVGHGGFPYFREKKLLGETAPETPVWKNLDSKNLVPSARILDGINTHIEDGPQDYGPNGYMTLELDGAELFEIVHMPDGKEVWNQPIDA